VRCKHLTCSNEVPPKARMAPVKTPKVFCSVACASRSAKRDWKLRNKDRVLVAERARKKLKYAADAAYRARIEARSARRHAVDPTKRQAYQQRSEVQERNRLKARAWRASRSAGDESKRLYSLLVFHKRRKAPGVGVTAQDWQTILESSGNACTYCGTTEKKLELDHVVPLAKGGEHAPHNIVPACHSCNCRKRDRAVAFSLPSRNPVFVSIP
jgi:5-methylcytosine-specific restriction endonuclease McrA